MRKLPNLHLNICKGFSTLKKIKVIPRKYMGQDRGSELAKFFIGKGSIALITGYNKKAKDKFAGLKSRRA